jgi:hypothetical protein
MELDNLGSAESFTLTSYCLPGNKFKVRSATSGMKTANLADQVLELRMRGEQVHAIHSRKAMDAYSRVKDPARQAPPDDI